MPIYMDVHIVPGVKARDVAEAHRKDLLHQDAHQCKCMTYWIDEERENIFCLIEAPNKEAVEEMHNRAHGLIPNKIIEVSSALVESFLGRIYDPTEAEVSSDGLKIFTDPSFRVLMVTKMADSVLLAYKLGNEKASALLNQQNSIIRKNLSLSGGSEVEHGGTGVIASFTSAAKAVGCALAIQKELVAMDNTDDSGVAYSELSISINAGEPVNKSDKLFGDTIQLARYMGSIAKNGQLVIASAVKELVSREHFQEQGNKILTLPPQDERLLELLFNKLEENWQNPDFSVEDYCKAMAMSKSQLYRKTIELAGLSPNVLLKEFRLAKAKDLMKERRYNISQITFDSGFSSPSYFTKCFKKKYGLLPMAYLERVEL
jgi:AraC-like DNA-binding protein